MILVKKKQLYSDSLKSGIASKLRAPRNRVVKSGPYRCRTAIPCLSKQNLLNRTQNLFGFRRGVFTHSGLVKFSS